MDARAALPAAAIGASEPASDDASDDEGPVDDEEAEPASDENTPTLVAGAASSIDH